MRGIENGTPRISYGGGEWGKAVMDQLEERAGEVGVLVRFSWT